MIFLKTFFTLYLAPLFLIIASWNLPIWYLLEKISILDCSAFVPSKNDLRANNLKSIVVTSVTRDDLDDGGSSYYVKLCDKVKSFKKDIK